MMGKVGRPKSENPRDMTLPETRMTRGEWRVAKLKAALYAGGSMARLVRDAIQVYRGELADDLKVCPFCDSGKLQNVSIPHEYYFQIGDVEHCITVTDIPAKECTACNETSLDLILLAGIEEILADVVERALPKSVALPEKLRFEQLLEPEMSLDEKGTVTV